MQTLQFLFMNWMSGALLKCEFFTDSMLRNISENFYVIEEENSYSVANSVTENTDSRSSTWEKQPVGTGYNMPSFDMALVISRHHAWSHFSNYCMSRATAQMQAGSEVLDFTRVVVNSDEVRAAGKSKRGAILLPGGRGKEVCYERLGCFRDGLPLTRIFSRKLTSLPWPPEKINTRFLLYTIHNPKVYQEISAVNYLTIQTSHFGTDKITRINIPGWNTNGKWQRDMCNVLLQAEDINCINLDWINGSLKYIHAVNNLRVAGAEVAYFIDVLMKKFGYSPSKVHLIGHSVGAHLAGDAGSRIPGLGRITGLDPAGPFFHNSPKEFRLDPSDASFVDVIHTNAVPILFKLGVGVINACGHLDFYPNGGKYMPGCEDLIKFLFKFHFNDFEEEVFSVLECNHARSHRFYIESILKPDAFIAYPCRSYKSFKAGNCSHCPKGGCPTMGHFADRFHLKNMKTDRSYYFLNTGSLFPFARWQHKLSIKLSGNKVTQGSIFLRIGGTIGKTGETVIFSGELKPGMIYTKLIDVDMNVGNITSIEFIWNKHLLGYSQDKLGAEIVTDISGKYGYKSTFCSWNITGPNTVQILKPC
ncbi:pancreatic lipase-related protein 3 [Tupaia chinensis]|uniref:pancreatic lipase-related protein 3 n=1 Tax=Tupaia chinensis TaxID=246437 RepID=UPI0007041369|nr:pancreatic lipase-related protein 3 [Tupaia chinensis]